MTIAKSLSQHLAEREYYAGAGCLSHSMRLAAEFERAGWVSTVLVDMRRVEMLFRRAVS